MSPQQPRKPETTRGLSADSPPSDPPEHAARHRSGDALLGRALAQVRYLREHCPWDARQTARSLRPYLLEEAHEVADAIAAGATDTLAEELGDLLLNLAFQVVVAEEAGAFDARRVVEALEAKMRARHPHVYGDAAEAPDWEAMKARERNVGDDPTSDRERASPFAGVPEGLEPLARALRVQQRAAAVGFDWPDARGALAKLREEIAEVEELLDGAGASPAGTGEASRGGTVPDARLSEEVGDLLFAAVNVARLLDLHPEHALDGATAKFRERFERVHREAERSGTPASEATLEELEELWRAAKDELRDGPPEDAD